MIFLLFLRFCSDGVPYIIILMLLATLVAETSARTGARGAHCESGRFEGSLGLAKAVVSREHVGYRASGRR